MPHAVYAGKGALANVKDITAQNAKKIAVFADQGIIGAGLLEAPLNYIKKKPELIMSSSVTWQQNQHVIRHRMLSMNSETKAVISSLLSAAVALWIQQKLCSILATDEYQVRDLLDNPKLAKKCVKSLMIPTTAGTGAEATPNAIVAVPEKELKVGIVNDEMIPDYVILDGEMIKTCQEKIAASTGYRCRGACH